MPKYRRDDDPSVYMTLNRDNPDAPPAARVFGHMKIEGEAPVRANGTTFFEGWSANVSVGVKGDKLSIGGRLYPHRIGGYWSDDAIEFRAEGTCEGALPISEVKFHRVVKY